MGTLFSGQRSSKNLQFCDIQEFLSPGRNDPPKNLAAPMYNPNHLPRCIVARMTFAGLCMGAVFVPPFFMRFLPLIPNWPYIGYVWLGGSVAVLGLCFRFGPHCRKPMPDRTLTDVLGMAPLILVSWCCIWSLGRIIDERQRCLQFADGRVVEKSQKPPDFHYSLSVEVEGMGTVEVESVSEDVWSMLRTGSHISKRAGSSDIAVLAR
jgi:hypothetical protein